MSGCLVILWAQVYNKGMKLGPTKFEHFGKEKKLLHFNLSRVVSLLPLFQSTRNLQNKNIWNVVHTTALLLLLFLSSLMYMVMEQSFQTRTKIRERGNFVAATVAMSVGHQCLAKFLWILFCLLKVIYNARYGKVWWLYTTLLIYNFNILTSVTWNSS